MNAARTKRSSRVKEPLRFIFSVFVAASDTTSIQAFQCDALRPIIKAGQASCFRSAAAASYRHHTTLFTFAEGHASKLEPLKNVSSGLWNLGFNWDCHCNSIDLKPFFLFKS